MARFSMRSVLLLVSWGMVGSSAWAVPATRETQVRDLGRQVEAVVDGRLRTTGEGQAQVAVSLWNTADRPILGPIFLIIDGSGIDSVAIANHAAITPEGKGVFEIVPAGRVLIGHGMTPDIDLVFAVPRDFPQAAANAFRLSARVMGRLGEAVITPEEEDRDFATRGKSYDQAMFEHVMAVQDKYTPQLMQRPGVFGTGIGENDKGNLVVRVYTQTRAEAKSLPGHLDDIDVDVQPVPGGFKAGPARNSIIFEDGVAKTKATREKERAEALAASGNATPSVAPGGDPTIRFDRPVPIGASCINADEVCASATLGCRCVDASGKLYALSNSHVFAREGLATRGEPIVQPSQGDNNCVSDVANNQIGTLVDFVPFNFVVLVTDPPQNVMDCGLMEVMDATDPDGNTVPAVDVATPEDGYGTPSNRILRANRIGLQVQKYGRTTIYTRGYTSGTRVSGIVGYTVGLVNFMGMDEYQGLLPSLALSQAGDSGSLIVTIDERRPVSILFAGNGIRTLANPIGPVLDRFNVTIDDGSRDDTTTGGTAANGISGRQGVAVGNLGHGDDDIIRLPPELRGRIKNASNGLVPKIKQSTEP